ncbi:MAG: dihydrodipicolinate synthase family protein [Chloroflexi bacterium]|nr:dihydrodipicolinate synthase family protein [Chloroflexota bacterium]
MSKAIKGIFNILATPFTGDGAIDFDSLRRLVNFQLDMGAYGLTILGVLGEAAKLHVDERAQVLETVLDTVQGRVPVIVGASHQDLHTCIHIAKSAVQAGATGVMIAPPRMKDPTDEQIIALYSEIAEHVTAPIVVQDFPPVNGVIMKAEMLAALADRIPNANYLKLEDPPLMEKIGAIRALTDQFAIFGGLGGMFLLEELGRGVAGTMTGFAFTEILVAVYQAWERGDRGEAERIFDLYLPLIRYENQPIINLTIRKELLRRRGAIAHATLREPFAPIDTGTHGEMTWILKRVGIDDATRKLNF